MAVRKAMDQRCCQTFRLKGRGLPRPDGARGDLLACLRIVTPGADKASTSVRTIAGTGRVGTGIGTGDVTDLVLPAGVAIRSDGALFVTDAHHGRVLLVRP